MKKMKMKTGETPADVGKKSPGFNARSALNGSYAMGMAGMILALILVINLIIGALPAKFIKYDLSKSGLYTIGEETKEVLASLSEDVTMYFLTKSGSEDTTIETLLKEYESESRNVNVKKVDIIADPTFTPAYTEDTVPANSVIVECGDKFRIVDYYDIYMTDMQNGYSAEFDGEGQITSAIASVTGGESYAACVTTGHGEILLSESMEDALAKADIETRELNLLSSEIPGDCDFLIIFAPMQDFTPEEAAKVRNYLADGGHALIVSVLDAHEMTNFGSILGSYGVSVQNSLVLEKDPDHYMELPYLLLPNISSLSEVTDDVSGSNLISAYAAPISTSESQDAAYTVLPLLSTSESAYLKPVDTDTIEYAEGDVTGSFLLGVQVEQTMSVTGHGVPDIDLSGESVEEERGKDVPITKILCYSTPCIFSSDAFSSILQTQVSMPEGNMALFAESISYLADRQITVSVPAKSMMNATITVSEKTANVLGNVYMFVIPGVVLGAGAFFMIRRRAR